MSNRILLQHQTRYQYARPVYLSPHLFRLKPAAHSRTLIDLYSFVLTPADHLLHWQQDPFGNFLARIDFVQPVQELIIEVKLIVTIHTINPFDFFLDEYAQYYPFEYETPLNRYLSPYLEIIDSGPILMEWLGKLDQSRRRTIEFLVMVNQLVYTHVSYTTRLQPGVQTSEESLEMALGSCRDSAWLLVQILRHLGLATRFVSGYLVQLADKEKETNALRDIMALHAWAEVYIPGAGWIGLDPTGGLLAAEGHIPLASTPDPSSAAPISGSSEISETTLTYTSSIIRF